MEERESGLLTRAVDVMRKLRWWVVLALGAVYVHSPWPTDDWSWTLGAVAGTFMWLPTLVDSVRAYRQGYAEAP